MKLKGIITIALIVSILLTLFVFNCTRVSTDKSQTTSILTSTSLPKTTITTTALPPTNATSTIVTSTPSTSAITTGSVIIIGAGYANQITAVHANEKISWVNKDQKTHSVTANDGMFFIDAILKPGDTYEFSYGEPGVYIYHCTLHPNEQARLIIE
jgi:plastocyanin